MFVVSENSLEVLALSVTVRGRRAALGKARSLGKLPRVGNKRNKGWEGIAVRPARFPDGEERLVAVHEGTRAPSEAKIRRTSGLGVRLAFVEKAG